MPSAPIGFCPEPGCTERSHGPCRKCRQKRGELRRLTMDKRYGTQRWRRYSQERIAQHPFCVDCRQLAEVTDHVLPVRTHPHLFWEPSNHASRCQACNKVKAKRDAALEPVDGVQPDGPRFVIA
jgi:5-methylcytosine-specific restriction enzyme A